MFFFLFFYLSRVKRKLNFEAMILSFVMILSWHSLFLTSVVWWHKHKVTVFTVSISICHRDHPWLLLNECTVYAMSWGWGCFALSHGLRVFCRMFWYYAINIQMLNSMVCNTALSVILRFTILCIVSIAGIFMHVF